MNKNFKIANLKKVACTFIFVGRIYIEYSSIDPFTVKHNVENFCLKNFASFSCVFFFPNNSLCILPKKYAINYSLSK